MFVWIGYLTRSRAILIVSCYPRKSELEFENPQKDLVDEDFTIEVPPTEDPNIMNEPIDESMKQLKT